ncbi:nephrin-like isoform X2 [Cloeon dipterum]|uniref:nephrin-like isoform X2 n=1 Tax=Cloeon dipterum TaxID=197152 RepID=UPI0032203447
MPGHVGLCLLCLAAVAHAVRPTPPSLRVIIPEKTAQPIELEGVVGRSVRLPCNVTPVGPDRVYMVLWFRDESGIPIYSYDVRGKSLSEALHWSAPEVFGSRAKFHVVASPAQLLVEDLREHDEGIYRCRVDFKHSPSRSFRYKLSITVPPEKPVIFDSKNRQLNYTLGPLREGEDVVLTCRVKGGRPEPTVTWLVGGNLVDEQSESSNPYMVENKLVWPAVARHDLGSSFTCRAVNSKLVDPRDTNLKLDLYLNPLTVHINKKPNPLKAEQKYEVSCTSAGSRPSAVITWYKGKKQLLRRVKDENSSNLTLSEMVFTPTTDDDGKHVTCRAENPNVTGAYMEDTWRIEVVYPPILLLKLGSTLNPDDIKEGDDVYFECHVRANPPWRKLNWLHNGLLLTHNTSARIIRSNQSLVLQKVTRQSAGKYACAASNTEGEGTSNELDFRVKYAPVCRQEKILVVGASRGETLDIKCEVESDPPVVHFRWKFNNSGETLDVSPERFYSDGPSSSVLRYTTASELDYGSLSCWAVNAVGHQVAPCVFQVVAAGKPFPVRNCTFFNQTSSSVEVACTAGFDGGLPQHFALELVAVGGGLRYNITSEQPFFVLADLEPGITFQLSVYAVNAKGRSQPTVLDEISFRDSDRHTVSSAAISLSPIVGVGTGVAFTLVALFLLLGIKSRRACSSPSNQPMTASPPKKRSNGNQHQPKDPDMYEEKDPDLIPAKYLVIGSDHEREVGTSINNGVVQLQDHQKFKPWPSISPKVTSPVLSPSLSATRQVVGSASWGNDPLRLPSPGSTAAAQQAQQQGPSTDVELNGVFIKERLMANRLPESCV